MSIRPMDYPRRVITTDEKNKIMDYIRNALSARIQDDDVEEDMSRVAIIEGHRMRSGQIVVTCGNVYTSIWLNEVVKQIALGRVDLGFSVECVSYRQEEVLQSFSLYCCEVEKFETIKLRLKRFKRIDTDDWFLLSQKPQEKGIRFIFTSPSFKDFLLRNKFNIKKTIPFALGHLRIPILIDVQGPATTDLPKLSESNYELQQRILNLLKPKIYILSLQNEND